MDFFENISNRILCEYQLKNEQFFVKSLDLFIKETSFENREIILHKLLLIYPEKCELYYYLGCFYKQQKQMWKAMVWFELCFQKNKYHKDNVFEYVSLIFELKLYKKLDSMNLDDIDDDQIQNLRAIHLLETGKLDKAETIFINTLRNKELLNSVENIHISTLINISFLYVKKNDMKKAMKYSIDGIELIEKKGISKINEKQVIMLLSNMIFFQNYFYNIDQKNLDKAYFMMNQVLKPQCQFNFKKSKKNQKIKIGYLSFDFIGHAISNFILPILKHHNKDKFDIYLFNLNPNLKVNYEGIKEYNISKMENIPKFIYDLKIDILFDLSGFTAENRLDIFAVKPARIQISYLGYANTTNIKTIDYRITDFIADPLETKQQYSEKLIRLPKCFLLFENQFQKNPIIHNTHDDIILASLNKESKISENVWNCWKEIMKQTAPYNTKLLIKIIEDFEKMDNILDNFCDKLEIDDPNRIILKYTPKDQDYFDLFADIDVLLDTFPYSGTTTTCNALYNSIPVVTLNYPNLHVHNVSSSLLINSNLQELVAYSEKNILKKL